MQGNEASRKAPARAIKAAKRRRAVLTARFSARPAWPLADVGPHGSDVPQMTGGVTGMTVEDLVGALQKMPQSYPVAAASFPSAKDSWFEEGVTVLDSWVVAVVRLVEDEVFLA